jgi:hypothetical protein
MWEKYQELERRIDELEKWKDTAEALLKFWIVALLTLVIVSFFV